MILNKPYKIKVLNIEEFTPNFCICAYDWSQDWRQEEFISISVGALYLAWTFTVGCVCWANGAVQSQSGYMCSSKSLKVFQIVENNLKQAQAP